MWLLANAIPADITGWLMWALVCLCGVIASMAVWYARVKEPAFTKQITDIMIDSASMLKADRDESSKRLDAKDAAYLAAIALMRQECREERLDLHAKFDQTLQRNEDHMRQLFDTQKEDMTALTKSLSVLSQAVGQLPHNAPRKPIV